MNKKKKKQSASAERERSLAERSEERPGGPLFPRLTGRQISSYFVLDFSVSSRGRRDRSPTCSPNGQVRNTYLPVAPLYRNYVTASYAQISPPPPLAPSDYKDENRRSRQKRVSLSLADQTGDNNAGSSPPIREKRSSRDPRSVRSVLPRLSA